MTETTMVYAIYRDDSYDGEHLLDERQGKNIGKNVQSMK